MTQDLDQCDADEGAGSSDYDIPEDHVTFADCTCEHDSGRHGWDGCQVQGCPCEGSWEE